MHQQSLSALAAALKSKQFSSLELTEHFLNRIKQLDPALNSFISVTEENALAQARAADQKIANGEAGALTGLPLAHKDIFCTQGIKTSCGSKMLDNFIAPYNAHIVENMQQAGMVMLGKTNMDEFAMGSSNESSFYGKVHNPWDLTRVPGGSSGGAAAAVAARLTPASTGSDTGGSIRQPAAFCGVTGLKPTYGRVSRYGMIAFASSLDQAGPLAHNACDLGMLLNAMAGFDERDSTSSQQQVEDYTKNLNQPMKGLRIGLPRAFFNEQLDEPIKKATLAAAKELEKLGAILVDIELPNMHLAIPCYYIIAPAECSSNLSRYDGIRYGHRSEKATTLDELYEYSRSEGFGDEVKRRILTGTYALSTGYYDAYYIKAQKIRRLIRDDFLNAFQTVDIIMAPTTPTTAFELDQEHASPVENYLADIYTIAVNLAGLPGLSMPVGFSNNLPIGAQLIGTHFDEARLLAIAYQYQQVTGHHQQIPEGY